MNTWKLSFWHWKAINFLLSDCRSFPTRAVALNKSSKRPNHAWYDYFNKEGKYDGVKIFPECYYGYTNFIYTMVQHSCTHKVHCYWMVFDRPCTLFIDSRFSYWNMIGMNQNKVLWLSSSSLFIWHILIFIQKDITRKIEQ